MPPPVPPSVKLGRITIGYPLPPMIWVMRFCTASASSMVCAMPDLAECRPMPVIASLNFSRSSAFSIAFSLAPIISTPYFCSTPWRCRSSAQLSAVWPPIVGSTAKPPGLIGRSLAMIFSTTFQVIGSM